MEWRGVGVSRMTTTEKEIIEEIRKNMISIAKPYLIDSQADPFIKEAAKTLLIRIENEESWVGKLIIGIMNISHVEGIKAGREQGEIIGRLLCANENHAIIEKENIDKGRKQRDEELNAQADKGVEILRYVGCLDEVDNDVAKLALSVMSREGTLISLAELTENLQKVKNEFMLQGRKQLAEEILIDSRLNSQINEAGIRLILKEKLQKDFQRTQP